MPIVSLGAFVLVTGATGFIASHAVDSLLKRGFRVRGTVRTKEKGEHLKRIFNDAGDRFHYVIVEDLQKERGFDEAVKGVDGILHIASPLHHHAPPSGVWENIIEPAKNGTKNVLRAALKYNPDVKRIVITSSYGAIFDQNFAPGTVFCEKDWNTPATDDALAKGDDLDPFGAYLASKVWSEQIAWEFMEVEKPRFDITTILPPLVCGPVIHLAAAPRFLNRSNVLMWKYLTGSHDVSGTNAKSTPKIPVVDVRDVANAHIESLLRPEAGNKRIGISKGTHFYQEFLDIIHASPELKRAFPDAKWGEPGARDHSPQYGQDASLSEKLLGLKYRNLKETVIDAANSLLERNMRSEWEVKAVGMNGKKIEFLRDD